MKKRITLLFMFLLTLASCNNNNNDNSSFDNSSISSSELILSEESSEEFPKEYQKDDEGFFILEDDYFKNNALEDGKSISKIRFNETLPEEVQYSQLRMYIGDKKVPLYNCKTNISQTWSGEAPSRMNNAVALIELEGKVEIKLQANFAFLGEHTIRPLSANITPKVDDNRRVLTFTVTSPGQYTIDFRSGRTLHLFVNKYKEYDSYKNTSNLIYFGPGIHTKDTSARINDYHEIILNSNSTVFIDNGAIIRGVFRANNKENIKIIGGGVVDGSTFERSVENGRNRSKEADAIRH